MDELTLIKAEILTNESKDQLNVVIYQTSKQKFIRVSKQISKEFTQEIYHQNYNIQDIVSENEYQDIDIEEIKNIYDELNKKKNMGRSLRYKVSSLTDSERKSLTILEEVFIPIYRENKLDEIGIR